MKDRYFIDTNVFVYSFDTKSVSKRKKAQKIITLALEDGNAVISYQVVQEFLNVALGKFKAPMTQVESELYLNQVLVPLCKVFPSQSLYSDAISINQQFKFSFYDSLIVASARQANCKIIYSEDMQHGQRIYDLTIENPFT